MCISCDDYRPLASSAALPYALAVAGPVRHTLHMVHIIPDTNFVMMTGGIYALSGIISLGG